MRAGSRPEGPVDPLHPNGKTEGVRQYFNEAPNLYKGVKRKHRLRIGRLLRQVNSVPVAWGEV